MSARPKGGSRVSQFWRRVTEGMELNQLWSQFRADARSSYHLYSSNVELKRPQGVHRGRHFWSVVGQFFWAVLDQLSPARRVILLLGLVFLVFAGGIAFGNVPEGVHVWIF